MRVFNENVIRGIWSCGVKYHEFKSKTIVIGNLVGYIHIQLVDYDIFETFDWNMKDGFFNLKGRLLIMYKEGRRISEVPSTLVYENVSIFSRDVNKNVIKFNGLDDWGTRGIVQSLAKNLDDIIFYKQIYDVICGNGQTNYLKTISQVRSNLKLSILERFPWLKEIEQTDVIADDIGVGWYFPLYSMLTSIEMKCTEKKYSLQDIKITSICREDGYLKVKVKCTAEDINSIIDYYQSITYEKWNY